MDLKEVLLQGEWDQGVFSSELQNQSIIPRDILAADTNKKIQPPKSIGPPSALSSGTYRGTKIAMTQIYNRIEQRFNSFFDTAGFEASVPQDTGVEAKQLYTFQKPGSDNYPPHLDIIPKVDQVDLLKIFDFMRLLDTGTLLGRVVPDNILDFIHDHPEGATIDKIEQRNNELHQKKEDIFAEENIGNRDDWYTDAVFAQQQFTGPNPTTIQHASAGWVKQFAEAAQPHAQMYHLISSAAASSLYVQDCSYFRDSVGVADQASMTSNDSTRFLCGAVTLFQLRDEGTLHPLAIVLDYKGKMVDSVVIFNKRLQPSDRSHDQRNDWPWRYAKTCAQVSDWMRHEVTVHLVNTHLVEEATIVATHRSFDANHPVYRLLQPHWLKTLSLNAAARSALVPSVIAKIVGVTDNQLYTFVSYAYHRFDWTAQYVPNDLAARGFPPDQLSSIPKFHNYTYGRNMILMWQIIRHFVSSVLAIDINSDDDVAKDPAIAAWTKEIRSETGAQLKSFPEIKTIKDLVDAVTMCIHIASPQHTAVNYLQNYYQTFVINKPSALCAPLPKTIQELGMYKEVDLLAAFPIHRPREWLMASHVPHLLSYRVSEKQNLLNYALSTSKVASLNGNAALATAAAKLYADLLDAGLVFKRNSDGMDDQRKPYDVMDPDKTAVSILI